MAIFTSKSFARQAADEIRALASQQFDELANTGLRGWNLLWNNQSAKPEDVIAELGTDLAGVFALATLNIGTVIAAAQIGGKPAPAIPGVPENYTVTVNPDGSGTATKNA